MGARLLGAGEGARVRGLEAWLLLPDANLLPERGGTEPGESFGISTHAQPRVSRRTGSKTLAIWGGRGGGGGGVGSVVFFWFFVTGDKLTKPKTCKLLASKRARQRLSAPHTPTNLFFFFFSTAVRRRPSSQPHPAVGLMTRA